MSRIQVGRCAAAALLSVGLAVSGAGTAAADVRPTDDSCPAGQVPEDGFSDVPESNVHEAAIDCLGWWAVANGTSATTYSPAAPVSRAQMASFIVRMVEESGAAFPADPPDAFDDDGGSVHEPNINKLASVGVVGGVAPRTYAPTGQVSRAQMASFLVRTYEAMTQVALQESTDSFSDDSGNPHESNINKAAEAGFTGGTSAGAFSPAAPVRRDAMASFITRALDGLVEGGYATPPGSDPGTPPPGEPPPPPDGGEPPPPPSGDDTPPPPPSDDGAPPGPPPGG